LDYEFRDEYYEIEWLNTGTWYFIQLFNTLMVLLLYSPSRLKNIMIFHGEVQTTIEHSNIEGTELEYIERETISATRTNDK